MLCHVCSTIHYKQKKTNYTKISCISFDLGKPNLVGTERITVKKGTVEERNVLVGTKVIHGFRKSIYLFGGFT